MGLIDTITEWIKDGMITAIIDSFTGMFDMVNQQVGDVAAQVGRSPEAWNPGIFSMIRGISETAIIPIAGIILTFVMCYELIHMIIDTNNMHGFETVNLFKWVIKTCIATYILTHTFDIVMGVFAVAQYVINQSAGVISSGLDISVTIADLETKLEAMGVWELIGLWMETAIIRLCMGALSIAIFIVVWGRLIEIYLTVSVAPIPLATLSNREWGQIGNNYLKALFAIGFQGFLMMVCIAIYSALVATISSSDNMHASIWSTAGYTALLCFALFKTGSLSKSLFGAH
jgi:hypothetical protein